MGLKTEKYDIEDIRNIPLQGPELVNLLYEICQDLQSLKGEPVRASVERQLADRVIELEQAIRQHSRSMRVLHGGPSISDKILYKTLGE